MPDTVPAQQPQYVDDCDRVRGEAPAAGLDIFNIGVILYERQCANAWQVTVSAELSSQINGPRQSRCVLCRVDTQIIAFGKLPLNAG